MDGKEIQEWVRAACLRTSWALPSCRWAAICRCAKNRLIRHSSRGETAKYPKYGAERVGGPCEHSPPKGDCATPFGTTLQCLYSFRVFCVFRGSIELLLLIGIPGLTEIVDPTSQPQ